MSETARTLVQSAMKAAGILGAGISGDGTQDETDAFLSFQFMLRNWSQNNIRIPYSTNESITLTGAASYTWGSGGDITTARPEQVLGGYIADIGQLNIVGMDRMRRLKASSLAGGYTESLHYSPAYPLGILYAWPLASDTIVVDTMKELAEIAAITDSVTLSPGYDDAIKWNLAVRLCAEFGKDPSSTVSSLAISTMSVIETRNFAAQIEEATLNLPGLGRRYNIDQG